jgi:hypothetical protein
VVINGERQDNWICTFKPNPYFKLPMVINITNRKRVARFLGKPYVELTKDMPVILTQEMDKAFGGGRAMALRIGKVQPKTAATKKPSLTPSSSNWSQIVKWVAEGIDFSDKEKSEEALLKKYNSVSDKYDISVENLKKITDETKRSANDS